MKKISIILFTFLFITITGCEKYVSQDDLDPNNPTEATVQVLLPTVQVTIIATYTGSMARNSGMWVQHHTGTQFQSYEYGNYSLSENDVQNEWNTLYTSGIPNTDNIIMQSQQAGNPYYTGIGQICRVLLIGIATDFWGDVPNREAGKGRENLAPMYDPQEMVLNDIQTMLTDAINNLSQPSSANALLPGSEDLIFGGDAGAWLRAAWILKARYHNRLSQRDPAGSAANVLNDIAMAEAAGLSGNADDAMATFDGASNFNTWYDFINNRANYMKMSATLMDTMKALNDPRVPFYATDVNGQFLGAPVGSDDVSVSDIGPGFADAVTPLPLITYAEAKFLQAEAALRAGDPGLAQTAFTAALTASFGKFTGIDTAAVSAYVAANGTLSAGNELNQIMTQKWIAMFTQPEAWSDWRRTHLPNLLPSPSGVISTIPLRYPTEQNERLYNPNAIVVSNLTTPVWWDM